MSKATYWQRGEALDYTNATDEAIEAGTILILNDLVGVAGTDIAVGETGSVHIAGVFKMPKADETEEIALGAKVYYGSNGVSTSESSSDDAVAAGYAVVASTSGDTEAFVKLN